MTPLLFADTRRPEVPPLVPLKAAQVRVALTNCGGLEVDLPAFDAAYTAWCAEMQARGQEPDQDLPKWLQFVGRNPTLLWLREQGAAGNLVRFNCVWRNAKGFRRHYLHVDDDLPLLVGKCPKVLRHGNTRSVRWLMNVPKCIRKVGLRAPAGRVLIQGDIKSAFPTFMCRAAQDAVLFSDLDGEFHDDVAAALGIPRMAAKVINNALVGLMGPSELHRQFHKSGLNVTLAQAATWHAAWWGRYAASRSVIEVLQTRWRQALRVGPHGGITGVHPMLIVAPDGQKIRYSPAEVAGAPLPHGTKRGFPSMVSAIWQSIEATAQDLAVLALHEQQARIGLLFVLGMYDGLIYSVPEEHADAGARLVREAMLAATARIGYGARVTTVVHRYWWS